jgi:two-component system phosphate regulon response regulator OmpR
MNASRKESRVRVLVIDDDVRLRAMVVEYLTRNGFDVVAVGTCSAASARLARDAFEVIVLDLALPDGSGLDFCGELRAKGVTVAVVILSARGDDVDRVAGLDIGADDYLAKPCNPRELLARIHAVLRRTAVPATASRSQAPPLRFGSCTLDATSRVLLRDGEFLQLTSSEFSVLFALVSRPGQTLSRERLARLARGRGVGIHDRSIDMQVSRLRKLVEPDPSHPRYLRTAWGAGYTFAPDGVEA